MFSVFRDEASTQLGLPFMTIKIVSMDTLKINKLYDILKNGLSSFFLADGESLAVLLLNGEGTATV